MSDFKCFDFITHKLRDCKLSTCSDPLDYHYLSCDGCSKSIIHIRELVKNKEED